MNDNDLLGLIAPDIPDSQFSYEWCYAQADEWQSQVEADLGTGDIQAANYDQAMADWYTAWAEWDGDPSHEEEPPKEPELPEPDLNDEDHLKVAGGDTDHGEGDSQNGEGTSGDDGSERDDTEEVDESETAVVEENPMSADWGGADGSDMPGGFTVGLNLGHGHGVSPTDPPDPFDVGDAVTGFSLNPQHGQVSRGGGGDGDPWDETDGSFHEFGAAVDDATQIDPWENGWFSPASSAAHRMF